MKYFNVTQNEIDLRMFNIFVGISLGNKLLTPALCKYYVEWAHKNTKDNCVILIADKIDAINWQVFRGLTESESIEKVKEKSYGILGMFEKAKRTLAKEMNDASYISSVHIIFWDDIINEGYSDLRKILEMKYKTNQQFKEKILYFVDKYCEFRESENILTEEKDKLANYIIDELPTLIGGVFWDNKLYNLILYPTYVDSGMSQFVLDIRGGKYFNVDKLKLRQICVLVEDYLEKPNSAEIEY